MRLIPAALAAAAVALAFGGCKPRPVQQKLPNISDVFRTVVLPPQSTIVSRQGGPDVLQLTLASPVAPDTVVAYYRAIFANDPFVLVSDTKGKDGAVDLYAEEAHRPMWVHITPGPKGEGTRVDLSGAVAARPTADSTRSTSAAAQAAQPMGAGPAQGQPRRDSAVVR
jgi:hypothetical protein